MGPVGMIVSAVLGVKILNAIGDHNLEEKRKEEEREWEKKRLKEEAERKKKLEEYEKERIRAEEIEKQRRDTPCEFNDGFTKEEFIEIAGNCAKKIRRIKMCVVDDLVVICKVTSQSGISDWFFSLDFRDFGHFTGRCWMWSENEESAIPDRLKESICSSVSDLKCQREA